MAETPHNPAPVRAAFRALDGAVEQALAAHPGPDQARALWLVRALTAGLWRGREAVAVEALTLGEFDGVLADLHAQLYGDALPCEAVCASCGERFEFSLGLAALRSRVAAEALGFARTAGDADDPVTAPSGRVFRLPRVGDLGRMEEERADSWLRSFLVEGDFDAEAMDGELSAASAVLAQDIAAPCPACGAGNTIRFDIARYLLQTLAGEAPFLWREVHLLARSYGWALDDILSLTRPVRRQLAALAVADAAAPVPRMRVAS